MKKLVKLFLFAFLICGVFSAVQAKTYTCTGYMSVYSKTTEQYIRSSDGRMDDLGPDEYIAFEVVVKNNLKSDLRFENVYFRVDGGEELRLKDFTLGPEQQTRCHIFYTNMQKIDPGFHRVMFYVNGAPTYCPDFYLIRAWNSLLRYPSDSQIAAVKGKARSPYITYYPNFSGTRGITEYSIDFWIDDLDDDTYFSTMDWDMDTSSLKAKYKNVYNDYNTPGGVYCGFQSWENGKKGVIMSVWDVFCEDYNGNVTAYRAKELYPEVKEGVHKVSGEGSFQQFIKEYNWKVRHPYRMLMQQSVSQETGNTVLTMWICDLVMNRWEELVSFDLGYYSAYMNTWDLGGFLENYGTQVAGYVRNVSFSNIRGRDYYTGRWVAADSVTFHVNNSIDPLPYMGSYNFGSDNSTYWIITSGVSGLSSNPADGLTYSVRNRTTESPY